jgi:hypothetical protein
VALFETPPRVGPKTPANTKPTKVGRWGWRGRSPLPGGLGDVPPKFSKKGKVAHSYSPATSGTQNAGKPKANEGGQRGSRGRSPLAEAWGVSSHKTLKGSG